jgi:hypothetical protein
LYFSSAFCFASAAWPARSWNELLYVIGLIS